MSFENALLIQEKLKNEYGVSVPWLQIEYNISYNEAKKCLRQLIDCSWVCNEPEGIEYRVLHQNLRLRKIKRSEVVDLIEDITPFCVVVLECIQKKNEGIALSELSSPDRDEARTRDVLRILLEHNLIFSFNGKYYKCVSKDTIDVLSRVVMADEKELDLDVIVRFFDKLFEE